MIISLWSVLWYRVWNLGRFNSGFTVVTTWLSPCTGQSVLWKMAPSFIENIVEVFACTMRESESFYRSTKAFSFRWQASAQYYRWRLSAEGDHTSNSCRSQSSTMAWFFYWNSSESTLFTHTFYYWSEWMDGSYSILSLILSHSELLFYRMEDRSASPLMTSSARRWAALIKTLKTMVEVMGGGVSISPITWTSWCGVQVVYMTLTCIIRSDDEMKNEQMIFIRDRQLRALSLKSSEQVHSGQTWERPLWNRKSSPDNGSSWLY